MCTRIKVLHEKQEQRGEGRVYGLLSKWPLSGYFTDNRRNLNLSLQQNLGSEYSKPNSEKDVFNELRMVPTMT